MARFRNLETGIVVSVADEKSARFTQGWEPTDGEPSKGRKRASAKAKPEQEPDAAPEPEADSE